ncbi:MAG: Kazal-type serine protease inhibitor family protein [Acidobacteriota bacterium]
MKKSLLVTLLFAAVLLSAGALYALSDDSALVDASETAAAVVSPTTEGPWLSTGFPVESVLSTNLKAECPRPDVYCLDVYDPVFCTSDGQTYSNACYAWRACATGCTAGGASS